MNISLFLHSCYSNTVKYCLLTHKVLFSYSDYLHYSRGSRSTGILIVLHRYNPRSLEENLIGENPPYQSLISPLSIESTVEGRMPHCLLEFF